MRKIKIYDLTFIRTARFAPEEYKVIDAYGNNIAYVRLRGGVLSVRVYGDKINGDFVSHKEISDISMFHSEERRDKWLTYAADKIKEVVSKYGRQ